MLSHATPTSKLTQMDLLVKEEPYDGQMHEERQFKYSLAFISHRHALISIDHVTYTPINVS